MAKFLWFLVAAPVFLAQAGCSSQPVVAPTGAASESDKGVVETAGAFESPPASESPDMRPALVQVPVPSTFRAIGTEPFWSVQVAGTSLVWSTPELPDGLSVPFSRKDESGVAIVVATVAGQPLTLEVSTGTCSDGMSDIVYPLKVIRRLGADVQQGCAR